MAHLLITGASAGIGQATVLALASRFSHMTLIGRDRTRHHDLLGVVRGRGVECSLVECDLASLDEVGDAAARVRATAPDIDVLIANAGVAGARGQTRDGFEIHFGVNHVAHHLLVTELAERITHRVVILSSHAHYGSTGVPLDGVRRTTRSLTGLTEYRDSKLANLLFGRELARRFPFDVHVVHPGLVATNIWRRVPWPIRPLVTGRMDSPAEGARTVTWAVSEAGLESGGYYASQAAQQPSAPARDDEAARALWDRTEEWVAPFRRSAR